MLREGAGCEDGAASAFPPRLRSIWTPHRCDGPLPYGIPCYDTGPNRKAARWNPTGTPGIAMRDPDKRRTRATLLPSQIPLIRQFPSPSPSGKSRFALQPRMERRPSRAQEWMWRMSPLPGGRLQIRREDPDSSLCTQCFRHSSRNSARDTLTPEGPMNKSQLHSSEITALQCGTSSLPKCIHQPGNSDAPLLGRSSISTSPTTRSFRWVSTSRFFTTSPKCCSSHNLLSVQPLCGNGMDVFLRVR